MAMRPINITARIDEALTLNELATQREREANPSGIDRMSSAGRCVRDRWASARGLPVDRGKGFAHNPKLLRVFRLGHILEDEVVALLEEAGYNVHSQQLEVGSTESGWLGHIDGMIDFETPFGIPRTALLEIKTCNTRRFAELTEMDSYAAWSPNYAAQLQAYMMHLPVEEALVVVYNKDTSELYHETVLFDIDEARAIEKSAALVTAEGSLPPKKPRAATSQFCKFCKWCDRSEWCWLSAADVEFDE